ncbi:MAG: hypothetical protein GX465_14780, partial [Acidobacteria bacterium]|nr:hypothetical protein [Acidobacteriota bacterium]
MNLQRREEISALLAAPVTGGAGQVLEYRDALMECRTHIDTLEQAAAERVIRDGSRGLGDGMVAVSREDAALAVEWCHAVQDLNPGYLEEKDRAARMR